MLVDGLCVGRKSHGSVEELDNKSKFNILEPQFVQNNIK